MNTDRDAYLKQMIEKTLEEHYQIKQLIESMNKSIENKPEDELSKWQQNMHQQALELYKHLKEHFDLEEDGGFMTPVLEAQPASAPTVKFLQDEHQVLLNELDKLVETMCQPACLTNPECEKLCEDFKQLMATLRKHERNEDQLMQSVYTVDIGTKD